jgi:DnaA-homolog protein
LRQLALDIGLAAAPDFESFIALGNEAAVRTLLDLQPGAAPVYLWGPSGCGKTHLLRALQAQAQAAHQVVTWLDGAGAERTPLADGTQWLLMDQAESWSPAQQQAAFSAFVQASAQGAAVVAAGRLPPVDLPIRDDIRTRLGWGLVLSLWPLGESDLRQALQGEALRRGLRLGDEVLDYALRRLSRDLKSLTGLLDRFDRYALQHQRPLTVPLLRQMLDEEP